MQSESDTASHSSTDSDINAMPVVIHQAGPSSISPHALSYDSKPVHPDFASPDADVVLQAKDARGTMFRVHSYTLKTTSGWFRTMFSLPQSSSSLTSEPIYMDEDSDTLEWILRMACGLPLNPIDSYDVVDSVLYAAEKYDMPGVMSIIRILVMTPSLFNHPFRLYIAACRFGWHAEAQTASTQTLSYNLFDKDIYPMLRRLPSDSLLDLFELHRKRREGLRKRLNDPPFVAGGTASCASCHAHIDYHTWRELKYKIILEMDIRPLGDSILEHGLNEWPEAHACWSAKCPNANCDRYLYDKNETVRVIQECVAGLPKSI
ncbi:hypothetical protein HGRIS_002349 [Hohenbuehelia grisea]|uniref:BTB domain-containing protein n=1 Tax=Hohenbuehelia grisea TaxID=104357 RepID=A0ABR3JL53_9AGAR